MTGRRSDDVPLTDINQDTNMRPHQQGKGQTTPRGQSTRRGQNTRLGRSTRRGQSMQLGVGKEIFVLLVIEYNLGFIGRYLFPYE